MNVLRRAVQRISGGLGRESGLVTFLRPAYDRWLQWSASERGLLQPVNDEEFLIDPRYRVHFPDVYEPQVWRHLKARVRPGDVCLNVGAHMGIYALALARWTAPGGRIFAFEPNPTTRAALARHVVLNGASDRIEILGEAVSAAPGLATFFATDQEGFSRLGIHNPMATHGKELTVPVTSIDAFCAERGLAPDWITLDIEGSEIGALEGARVTIARGRGRLGIIVEMHPTMWPQPASGQAMATLLSSLGLRAVGFDGGTDPLAAYGVVRLEYV